MDVECECIQDGYKRRSHEGWYMYLSGIGVIGVPSQTHIKWREMELELGVKTKKIYSVFGVVAYKRG